MNDKRPRALLTALVLLASAQSVALHAYGSCLTSLSFRNGAVSGDTEETTGQRPEIKMRGRYENDAHTIDLDVTPDKMILKSKGRPDTFSLDYRIIRVVGSDVTVQLKAKDPDDSAHKVFSFNLVISVRDDLLYIEPLANHAGGALGAGGVWTRK